MDQASGKNMKRASSSIIRILSVSTFLLLFFASAFSIPGTLLWEVKTGFRDGGGMVEVSGMVVTGNITSEGGVFAYAADTGKSIWRFKSGHMRGTPATDGQRIFAAVSDYPNQRLVALDLKTGKQLWSVSGDDKLSGDWGPLVDGGRVYLIGENGKVAAYAAQTGNRVWEFAYGNDDPQCPTGLTLSAGRLFFGGGQHNGPHSQGKFLWALDAATGKELWRYKAHQDASATLGECISTPDAAGDFVVSTDQNAVFAVDAKTGSLRWKAEVERMRGGYNTRRPLSKAIISKDKVYAAFEEALASWSLSNGQPLREIPGKVGSDPTRTLMSQREGVLFFLADLPTDGGGYGKCPLHALDVASGQILWMHRVNRPIRYMENWETHYTLPTSTGVYYENAGLLAKAAH